ncbi:MAG: SDR family oxidoreductase [Candidatus Symbiothrix sp.]|jgi:dTDP-4-dehydrorhamnose reductase|nr:SDR family oxidoreductase [Candidatus Symbiothrix sp.]
MSKRKILLFGATGMAGHIVYHYLNATNKYDITNIVFREKLTEDSIILDITDKNTVENLVANQSPDIIINCIGVLIKGSSLHPDNAIYINAYFPHLLARLSEKINAKLVHVSTDCVFSGKQGNYKETDFKDADDVYGRSKALGEIINDKDITIRTSIIGPELKKNGEGLFHWFMHQKGDIKGYTGAFWGGVTTLELAKAIDFIIEQPITGLVHLTNGEKISKFNLLTLLKEVYKRDNIEIHPYRGKQVDKSLQKSEKLKYTVPAYPQMLEEQYQWMNSHNTLYKKSVNENFNS